MKTNSIKFVYETINAIACRKHDVETEQCLVDAIKRELLAITPHTLQG
ncbi:MAG TPA: hypothetical protein VKD65_10420 [Candidatus Angelobacter sp.]|nr:hypothetical protein [Candidatus Angelobacter sp.]